MHSHPTSRQCRSAHYCLTEIGFVDQVNWKYRSHFLARKSCQWQQIILGRWSATLQTRYRTTIGHLIRWVSRHFHCREEWYPCASLKITVARHLRSQSVHVSVRRDFLLPGCRPKIKAMTPMTRLAVTKLMLIPRIAMYRTDCFVCSMSFLNTTRRSISRLEPALDFITLTDVRLISQKIQPEPGSRCYRAY